MIDGLQHHIQTESEDSREDGIEHQIEDDDQRPTATGASHKFPSLGVPHKLLKLIEDLFPGPVHGESCHLAGPPSTTSFCPITLIICIVY